PDEPGIGHEVPAICVMSRAAPVDADVAIAAYTWSATLTARCRDTGRYDPSEASSAARRSESSAAGTSRDNVRRGMSMTTVSPFSTSAIAPPAAASGATWHTDRPEVPPENRPSVISAQLRPSPLPLRNEVGYSISCMPGPPRGPSYRMITTSPADTAPPRIPETASSWLSNTTAGPENSHSSDGTPAVLMIEPSGARFPYSTASPPSAVYACGTSLMQPVSASVSSDDHDEDCEYGRVVRTPPGAAWYSETASAETEGDRRSHCDRNDASEAECTVRTPWFKMPARESSPRMVGMPPARCTSST